MCRCLFLFRVLFIFFPFLILFLYSGHSLSAQPEFYPLQIKVKHLKNKKGQIIIDLYQDETSYAEEIPLKRYHFDKNGLKNAQIICEIYIPEGTYAIAMIDDVNMDDKINRNLMGYPLEGFGFSNLHKFPLKKPEFKQIKFTFSCQYPILEILTLY